MMKNTIVKYYENISGMLKILVEYCISVKYDSNIIKYISGMWQILLEDNNLISNKT